MREAIILNEKGIKVPKKTKPNKKELVIPIYFLKVLEGDPIAKQVFDNFSYSHQKEYVEWVTEAKKEATREKRLSQMIEWLKEGKNRNWKYENC